MGTMQETPTPESSQVVIPSRWQNADRSQQMCPQITFVCIEGSGTFLGKVVSGVSQNSRRNSPSLYFTLSTLNLYLESHLPLGTSSFPEDRAGSASQILSTLGILDP